MFDKPTGELRFRCAEMSQECPARLQQLWSFTNGKGITEYEWRNVPYVAHNTTDEGKRPSEW